MCVYIIYMIVCVAVPLTLAASLHLAVYISGPAGAGHTGGHRRKTKTSCNEKHLQSEIYRRRLLVGEGSGAGPPGATQKDKHACCIVYVVLHI